MRVNVLHYIIIALILTVGCAEENFLGNEGQNAVCTDPECPDGGGSGTPGPMPAPPTDPTEFEEAIFRSYPRTKCEITYFIEGGTADIPDEIQQIANACRRWSDVSDLSFTRISTSGADVIFQFKNLGFVDKIFPGDADPGHVDPTNTVQRFIIFNDDYVFVDSNISQGLIYNFEFIAAHELGHVLGLGHSSDSGDLMGHWPNASAELGPGDLTQLHLFYSKPSDEEESDGKINILNGCIGNNYMGPNVICAGKTGIYTRPFGDPFSSEPWTASGGIQIKNQANGVVEVIPNVNQPGIGFLTASSCRTITIQTAPPAIIGLAYICPFGEGLFTINKVPSSEIIGYKWSVSDPNVTVDTYNGGLNCIVSGVTQPCTLSVKFITANGESLPRTKNISLAKQDAPCNDASE